MAWPDGGTNEVVKSVGATGRNYPDTATWEADTDEDCTAGWGAGDYADPCSPVGDCYDDADLAGAIIAGATTDSTHYRTLTVHSGQRHAGVNGSGVNLTSAVTLNGDAYAVVEWILFTGAVNHPILALNAGTGLMFQQLVLATTGNYGIKGGDPTKNFARNCIAHGQAYRSFYRVTAQNCSVLTDPTTHAFYMAAPTNCIACGSGAGAWLSASGDYNVGTLTPPGGNSIDGVAAADIFANIGEGTEDLHLLSDATAASAAALDLSAYFTDDIDADTRSDWDIGADECVGGAPPAGNRRRRVICGASA